MTSLINLSFPNDFMKSSYVQQYKQLEAQKMIVVDTIMNSYGGKRSANRQIWKDNLTEKDLEEWVAEEEYADKEYGYRLRFEKGGEPAVGPNFKEFGLVIRPVRKF